MFLRIDKLGVELPASTKYDPTAAAAVQELLGGRFGEMSTLNNYLHQSTAMRAKKQLGPFYELVASITAEEIGHVEVVAAKPSTHCSTKHPMIRTRTTLRSKITIHRD
jgi:Mn-containing catalase